MSTRRTFGNTWWGKQWLATLNNIDNANCLTQGRYCYLRGNVESFEWIAHEQRIEAFVSGSAYFPYQVNIELPKWSKQKTKQLLDAIAKDPLLVSELLQGTLSPAIPPFVIKLILIFSLTVGAQCILGAPVRINPASANIS